MNELQMHTSLGLATAGNTTTEENILQCNTQITNLKCVRFSFLFQPLFSFKSLCIKKFLSIRWCKGLSHGDARIFSVLERLLELKVTDTILVVPSVAISFSTTAVAGSVFCHCFIEVSFLFTWRKWRNVSVYLDQFFSWFMACKQCHVNSFLLRWEELSWLQKYLALSNPM